jgi:hypothetical protein
MYLGIVSQCVLLRSRIQTAYTEQRGRNCKADHEVKSGSTPEQSIGYHKHLVSVISIGSEVVYADGSGKDCR